MLEYEWLKTLIIVLGGAIIFFLLPKSRLYSFFFVVLLGTEFYYIRLGPGTARLYQFFAVMIVILLSKNLPRLLSSNVSVALLIFVGVNICAIILSDSPDSALLSILSFCSNIAIAFATALILICKKVKIEDFKKIILLATLISIIWVILQVSFFSLIGANIGFSPEQKVQISSGFGPGFRTEANTYAKSMVFPLLFFFPVYVYKERNFGWIYVLFLIGFLLNFTRSAIYGIIIAFPIIVYWFMRKRTIMLFWHRCWKIAFVVGLSIFLILCGVISKSKYAQHKIANLFSSEEIIKGGSGGGRLKMMGLVVEDSLNDIKKTIIGRGWGQNRYYYQGRHVIAGGGDLVNVLGYSGVIGLVTYLFFIFLAARSAWKSAMTASEEKNSNFAGGVFLSFVGMFCAGLMSGYLITPEYWIIIGLIIYLSVSQTSLQTGGQSILKNSTKGGQNE